jgi:hypothetical protein
LGCRHLRTGIPSNPPSRVNTGWYRRASGLPLAGQRWGSAECDRTGGNYPGWSAARFQRGLHCIGLLARHDEGVGPHGPVTEEQRSHGPNGAQPGGRQATMKPARSNRNGVAAGGERRRLVFGPPGRNPVGVEGHCRAMTQGWRRANPGLCCATPLGLKAPPSPLSRVVPAGQPWAWLHNRVAVEAAHYLCSAMRSGCRAGLPRVVRGGAIASRQRSGGGFASL